MFKETITQESVFKHRVITLLDRQELEFLDRLGKDSLFSTGHKLSYNEILRGLIDFAIEMNLSGERVGSLAALKDKMRSLIDEKEEAGHEKE